MSKYPVTVYDKRGKCYGTIAFDKAMFCVRKDIALGRDFLGKDVVAITVTAVIPTCIENDVDLKKLKKPVMEALKANETA